MPIEPKCITSSVLSVQTRRSGCAGLAQNSTASCAIPMATVRRRSALSAVFFGCLFYFAASASASIRQCEQLTPEQQVQANFCEAHVACRVAIGLLATCTDATTALRTFYDAMSTPPPGRPELAANADAQEDQRRLGQLEHDATRRRVADEPAPTSPALQPWTPMHDVDKRAIAIVRTDAASAAAPSALTGPSTPTARSPRAVDALLKDAISSADAQAEKQAQHDTTQRAAAVATMAVAENTTVANTPRSSQDEADAQSMRADNVGAVFALADRLEYEQQFDAARAAFRSLIARFPDHPLAAAAAARLATARAPSGAVMPNLARQGAARNANSCDAKVAEFEAELARLNERKPVNAPAMSKLQTVMYLASKSLALGTGICSGDRREDDLTYGMQASFEDAQRACANISVSAGDCVARAPSW